MHLSIDVVQRAALQIAAASAVAVQIARAESLERCSTRCYIDWRDLNQILGIYMQPRSSVQSLHKTAQFASVLSR